MIFLLIFAIICSTAFAEGIDLEDLQNQLDDLYTNLGYEKNPVFEMGNFSVALDGYHKIEEQTDNLLSLVGLCGSDAIMLNNFDLRLCRTENSNEIKNFLAKIIHQTAYLTMHISQEDL